jgi:hypothetical protein
MIRIVFLLQHLHFVNGDEEDVKMLGIYASRDSALVAVDRFRTPPGFRDALQLANASVPGSREGSTLTSLN